MINQAIQISGLTNHVLYSMQCDLNGVQTNKVPNFLVGSPSDTTHAIKLIDPLDVAHLLKIPLQLQ